MGGYCSELHHLCVFGLFGGSFAESGLGMGFCHILVAPKSISLGFLGGIGLFNPLNQIDRVLSAQP